MAIISEAFSRRLKFFTIQSIIALERVTFTRDCVMPWAQIRTLRPDFQRAEEWSASWLEAFRVPRILNHYNEIWHECIQ